ncbi:HET-domain-containing protein [Microthyrium microscopicum]|uniref:HET-domain-containing protein n=1 Tax=Microthyrium microscopicum TaxID=703497 RepID=A0A6A6UI05_9PEZI|nr:HET-domain-containing protein [Microthyrium microscopicum]
MVLQNGDINVSNSGSLSRINRAIIYPRLVRSLAQIRLFKIHPGEPGDAIRGAILIRDLDAPHHNEEVSYKALSHAWKERASKKTHGKDFVRSKTVFINDSPIEVTDNLLEALIVLRHSSSERVLWVDSLCIDQNNDAEKHHQVNLMRKIYRYAEEVIIWLGPEISEEKLEAELDKSRVSLLGKVFSTIGQFRTRSSHLETSQNIVDTVPSSSRRASKDVQSLYQISSLRPAGPSSKPTLNLFYFLRALAADIPFHLNKTKHVPAYLDQHKLLLALKLLMERSWWNRVWVIQETILATKATVVLGPIQAPWCMFVDAAIRYDLHAHSCCSGFLKNVDETLSDALSTFTRTILEFLQIRKMASISDDRPLCSSPGLRAELTLAWQKAAKPTANATLLDILQAARSREASDQRDKVYALLGLEDVSNNRTSLRPVYADKSLHQVLQETAVALFEATGSLDAILGSRKRYPANLSLPSWITDWSYFDASYERERLQAAKLFKSTVDRSTLFRELGSILQVRGMQLAVISDFSESLHPNKPYDFALDRLALWQAKAHASEPFWFEKRPLPPWKKKSYPSLSKGCEKVSNLFWQTICGGAICDFSNSSGYRRLTDDDRPIYRQWVKESMRRAFKGGRKFPSDKFREAGPPVMHASADPAHQLDHAIRAATVGRRFFQAGPDLYGLGPNSLKRDDLVFKILGISMPLVLRPLYGGNLGRYRVVGDCYVHGSMDWTDNERASVRYVSLL